MAATRQGDDGFITLGAEHNGSKCLVSLPYEDSRKALIRRRHGNTEHVQVRYNDVKQAASNVVEELELSTRKLMKCRNVTALQTNSEG